MRYIGHTRFSLLIPESPAWFASNGSRFSNLGEYRDYLYSDERLSIRSDIFFNISLPQLRLASEGHEFRHVISYSDSLPIEYREQLAAAADEYEFLVLDCHGERGLRRPVNSIAKEMFAGGGNKRGLTFGMFRLDDDDILAADFFSQMDQYVSDEHVGMQVSLGAGVTALYEGGKLYNPRHAHHPMIAIGLLNVCRFDADGQLIAPSEASHNRSDRTNPVILDSRKTSYVWLRHLEQDTTLRQASTDPREVLEATLKDMDHFPRAKDMSALAHAFPYLADRLRPQRDPSMLLVSEIDSAGPLDESGVSLETRGISGHVEFSIDILAGRGAAPGVALISFDFSDSSGSRLVSESLEKQIREMGIMKSPVRQIGYFKYLATQPGENGLSVNFTMPDDLRCEAITVRRWRDANVDLELQNLQAFSIQKDIKPLKIFIYGSCVSRDPFELDSGLFLEQYAARSSLASAFAKEPAAWQEVVDLDAIPSPFQRRMVASDLSKTLAGDLSATTADAIVLDFIDERMSTIDFADSVITDSPELASSGFSTGEYEKFEPWSERGWSMRLSGIQRLLELVSPDRIIVNRAYWATHDDKGIDFENQAWIEKNNALLRRLYDEFARTPGVRFVDYPSDLLVASSEHHFGRQPFHFGLAFNRHFLRTLGVLASAK
jgi:hypothetical protein